MSMIDCKVTVEKKPLAEGDRVVLTFEYAISLLFCPRRLVLILYYQREILAVR